MKANWTVMKNLISAVPGRADLYLSVIDENGIIVHANANMLKGLELKTPRSVKTSFFDLVHPTHIDEFKKAIQRAAKQKGQATTELFIKNGHYHPMKWQVNYLLHKQGSEKIYFCIGYSIFNSDRLKKFNTLLGKHCQLIMEGFTGIIFHDKDGEMIAANQQTTNLLNTSFEKLYQSGNFRNLWTSAWAVCNEAGDEVPFEKAPFTKALETKKPQKEILRFIIGNGQYRWVIFNSRPLPEEFPDDQSCRIVSNIIDVTNEKSLSVKLKEKETVINAFVSQTPNLAWIVDEDSRLILASIAFYRHFGLSEEDSLDRKMSELVPPSVFKSLYEKHIEVFNTGQPLKTVEKARLADGTNYISHVNIFPLENVAGKKLVGGYAVNLPDATSIETELRKTNEKLLTLTRVTANAIWEWDMQTGKIFRNDVLMEMIGYQPDDAKGLSWWLRRIHPEDRNRVSDKVKETTETNQYSWQDEYRFKCADGQYKPIQDKGFVVYENGLPVKMIGSLLDVSVLKELENKLANERLQKQKEISETVIQVQEKERTRIGHELHDNVNQILSSAMLFTDMFLPSGADQKQAKEKSLQYITMAIEEIRKLSKELVMPQLKEQGLVEGIRSLIEDFHITNAIRIKFTHELNADLLSSGKKITLFRIVQEQLKNILTHSKAKKAEIFLQAKQEDVQLIIKDNGVGFDPQKTHRGIGLSNIYERISFYNGIVDIQTAPGKGCTVIVTLPLN